MELLNWAKKVSRKARLHLDLRAQCQRALVLFPSHIYSNVAFFFVWNSSVARSYASPSIFVTR